VLTDHRLPVPERPVPARDRTARRVPWSLIVVVVLATVLAPAAFSYGRALHAPGGGTVPVRTVEWIRDHGGGGIVDAVENWYYARQRPHGSAPDPSQLPRPPVGAVVVAGPPRLPVPAGGGLPGEGAWTAVSPDASGAAPVATAWFRPDPSTPSVVAGAAWMDQHAVRTVLVPGTVDPGGPATSGGRVPAAARRDLLAAFNSGFKLRDAQGGFYGDGQERRPLRDGAASLVVGRDGRVAIGQWGRDVSLTPDVVSVRQNLALVVDGGAPVPGLDTNADGRWGSSRHQLQYTWRSGLGVDAAGNLVYVAADQITLADLARAMAEAGAVRGMQLDIHRQQVGLLTYGPGDAVRGTGHRLLPAMSVPADRWLHTDQRDFLAVVRRTATTPRALWPPARPTGPASSPPTCTGPSSPATPPWPTTC
jgi:hypothetical protein